MYQNISIPTQQRPPHADISNPHTAPAQLLPWLNYMATRTSTLRFSNGKAVAQYQMCTLNSKKSADIIDYIPESPEDPGANAKDNVRTWYRDAVAAYNHDMQTLSTLTNALLDNMGPNDATAIRALHPNDLTTRQIMQYLEEAYGTLGPSHLDYIVQHLLVWDPRLPARLNMINLDQYWEVLQYNNRNRFMSLATILAMHPVPLAMYQKFTATNPLSTDFEALSTYLNQRLPMGTDTGAINSVLVPPPTPQALMTQVMLGFEVLQQQHNELSQRMAEINLVAAPPTAPAPKKLYCFAHGMGHSGHRCKRMNNPKALASDGQPYSDGMRQARDPRPTPATRNIAGHPK